MIAPWRKLAFSVACCAIAVVGRATSPGQTDESPVRTATANGILRISDGGLTEQRIYIVQMAAPPALHRQESLRSVHTGTLSEDFRVNLHDPEIAEYARGLIDDHDDILREIGAFGDKVYSYRYTFNGFAARMTGYQAQRLRARRDVLNIWPDRIRYLETADSPAFLGLLEPATGLRSGLGLRGEDVIIGVIDSGIARDHPSFADRSDAGGSKPRVCRSAWAENSLLGRWLCRRFDDSIGELLYDAPPDWSGTCETGPGFDAGQCNNKLVGARFYVDGFLQTGTLDSNEVLSPLDTDGHGTHLASIAAGNEVTARLSGISVGRVTGIAPRARIAAYKACWLEPGQTRASCSVADLQRAIEDAVADGVDIINYSVGSADASLDDPDDVALLAASDAGVLAVVAAGNSGPGDATVLSPAGTPWVLTVAASSRSGRKLEEAMRIDTPAGLAGDYVAREASFTPPLRDSGALSGSLILYDDATDVLDDGSTGSSYDACEAATNQPALTGNIAYLQRGGCDFETKLVNVEAAGSVGALVFDNQGTPIVMAGTRGSVNIPAVMIGQADGQRVLDALTVEESVSVTFDKTLFIEQTDPGNTMAVFSARGPNLSAPDIIKPDVTAPGVDILGAQTPDVANGVQGETFQYLSGTSQATPIVAGIAALLREAHPQWSPAAVKSAVMTTARQNLLLEDGAGTPDPFDFGAGHVVPNLAVDPGLVYDAGRDDYLAFSCTTPTPRVTQSECDQLTAAGFPERAMDLNQPSIGVASLVASRNITRHVTNVGEASTYTASIVAPPGVSATVNPPTLSLDADQTGSFLVTLTSDGTLPYKWGHGSLTWDDGEHRVFSPISTMQIPFLGPGQIDVSGTAGNTSFDVEFGYDGSYAATVHGLRAPFVTPGLTVSDDPADNYVFEAGTPPASVARVALFVPDDQLWFRVSLFDRFTDGNDDLDLYVFYCPGNVCTSIAGVSGNDGSEEEVNLFAPPAGQYIVDVHGFETDPVAGGEGAVFDLYAWSFGNVDVAGNLSATAPSSAVNGAVGTVQVAWQDLSPTLYLGGISHRDGTQLLGLTLVDVEN